MHKTRLSCVAFGGAGKQSYEARVASVVRHYSAIILFMPYYVYILKCSDNSYYVGSSNNLKNRINYHNKGSVQSTSNRRPVKIIWYCCFENKVKSLSFEKYLKQGSGFAFTRKRLI